MTRELNPKALEKAAESWGQCSESLGSYVRLQFAISAYLDETEADPAQREELPPEFDEWVKENRAVINTPVMASLLYDINLLPEEVATFKDRKSMRYLVAVVEHFKLAIAAAPEPPVSGWLPIEAAPSAKSVLVAYKNRCDKWRVVKAVRYEQYQNEQPSDDDVGEVGEYCEEKDAYFVRAGWYELIDNWDDFGFATIYEGDPVAWMDLPAPPKQQEPK